MGKSQYLKQDQDYLGSVGRERGISAKEVPWILGQSFTAWSESMGRVVWGRICEVTQHWLSTPQSHFRCLLTDVWSLRTLSS